MGKRKVSILEPAATSLAEVSWFIESKGLPQTAKKFIDEAFAFFAKLADNRIEHKACTYNKWKQLGYRCISYKKKYTIAYLSLQHEIVICDFVSSKLLK
jgi:hypothetical protein